MYFVCTSQRGLWEQILTELDHEEPRFQSERVWFCDDFLYHNEFQRKLEIPAEYKSDLPEKILRNLKWSGSKCMRN